MKDMKGEREARTVAVIGAGPIGLAAAAPRLLEASGWTMPPEDELPTAGAMVVTGISREGFDKVKSKGREAAPFVIRATVGDTAREFRAWAVLDASEASSGCCGGPPKTRADACCGTDERIKDAGGSGCGSVASRTTTERARASACCR